MLYGIKREQEIDSPHVQSIQILNNSKKVENRNKAIFLIKVHRVENNSILPFYSIHLEMNEFPKVLYQ